MVEFETVKAEYIKFGRNNFIEIARKKVVGENGDREFVSIARGYYLPHETKLCKASITLPDQKHKNLGLSQLCKSYYLNLE